MVILCYSIFALRKAKHMNQIETVALWAGLMASIAGIVLSIVATLFALWVNKESTVVNQQMIKSLQKIESTVEHLSADTRELITAGWNKMLTGLGNGRDIEEGSSTAEITDQISAGVESEVQSELQDSSTESERQRIERLEAALLDLKETIASQLRRRSYKDSDDPLYALVEDLKRLPLESRAMVNILATNSYHLTRNQYLKMSKNPLLKIAIKRLRASGLLVPLVGKKDDGLTEPVYYFPPNATKTIRLASTLAGEIPKDILNNVSIEMDSLGYLQKV